jgi:hypothetical protein
MLASCIRSEEGAVHHISQSYDIPYKYSSRREEKMNNASPPRRKRAAGKMIVTEHTAWTTTTKPIKPSTDASTNCTPLPQGGGDSLHPSSSVSKKSMEDHSQDPSVAAVDELFLEQDDELGAYTKNGFDSREVTDDSNQSEDGNPLSCDAVPAMKSASRHQMITDDHRQLRPYAPQRKPKVSPKKRGRPKKKKDVNLYQLEDEEKKDSLLQVGNTVYAPFPNQDPKNEQCE